MKDLSANPDEAEVLIRSGARFEVLVVRPPKGSRVAEIHLEEVEQSD